jgi:hypothetical protein
MAEVPRPLPRRRWWGLLIALGVALAVTVGGVIPLLGLPGAFIFVLATPMLALVFGPGVHEAIPPDASWPLAIILTLLWPLCIVVGYALVYLPPGPWNWLRHLAFAAVLYGWGVALSVWAAGTILERW